MRCFIACPAFLGVPRRAKKQSELDQAVKRVESGIAAVQVGARPAFDLVVVV